MAVLKVSQVQKFYGPQLVLQNLNLEVEANKIFALLGPNGAGKTTLVKAILNCTQIAAGEIFINGRSWLDYRSHQAVAYFPEKFTFFGYYTVFDTLLFYGRLAGWSRGEAKAKVMPALAKCGIADLAFRKLQTLSKGQGQRVGIACLLMTKASFLILDEPFSGIDPICLRDFRNIFKEFKEQGKTIFLNSHLLSEVEKLADQVAVINKGRILAQGDLPAICQGHSLEDFCCNLIENDHGPQA